jgi:hypothetical protein
VDSRAGLDVCEKSRATGIRLQDRPTRSQSLYRLSYRAQFHFKKTTIVCSHKSVCFYVIYCRHFALSVSVSIIKNL